jgi:hypothetical protein
MIGITISSGPKGSTCISSGSVENRSIDKLVVLINTVWQAVGCRMMPEERFTRGLSCCNVFPSDREEIAQRHLYQSPFQLTVNLRNRLFFNHGNFDLPVVLYAGIFAYDNFLVDNRSFTCTTIGIRQIRSGEQ